MCVFTLTYVSYVCGKSPQTLSQRRAGLPFCGQRPKQQSDSCLETLSGTDSVDSELQQWRYVCALDDDLF